MHLDPFETNTVEYHPLDHRPGGTYCRTLPGGTRHHLSIAWEYMWWPAVLTQLKCRFGRHDWCPHATPELGDCYLCLNCCGVREL